MIPVIDEFPKASLPTAHARIRFDGQPKARPRGKQPQTFFGQNVTARFRFLPRRARLRLRSFLQALRSHPRFDEFPLLQSLEPTPNAADRHLLDLRHFDGVEQRMIADQREQGFVERVQGERKRGEVMAIAFNRRSW